MLTRTERHIVLKGKVNYREIDSLSFLSKNLYNYANYCIKKRFTKSKRFLTAYSLIKIFTRINQVDYRNLPVQTSQQILKLLDKNWISFFRSMKDWKKNKKKYLGMPRLPKFKKKNGRNIVVFTNQQISVKEGYISFPKKANLMPLKTEVDNIVQVRLIPQTTCYVMEVVYKKEKQKVKLNSHLYLGIDLGINNIATCCSNAKVKPVILNGRPLKSINQYYNKKKAKLLSILTKGKEVEDSCNLIRKSTNRIKRLEHKRNNLVSNYLHHCSRFIINYCINFKIKTIVIGKNERWKQKIEMGKRNNQNFVQVPLSKLIQQIEYKAEEYGIKVLTVKEPYTSKADHLALEKMEHKEKYLGKRIKRGLFKSSIGLRINADINAAIGMLRKVTGNTLVKELLSRGLVSSPIKLVPIGIDFNKVFEGNKT